MIYLLCRQQATDTTNGFSKIKNLSPDLILKVVAITIEPKEGIEEGGRAAGWVVAEVVRAAGCTRSRPCTSPWSRRHRRIGGALCRACDGVERRRGGAPRRRVEGR
jgi:hypothetical protein